MFEVVGREVVVMDTVPVSYTHLDVYKRQELTCCVVRRLGCDRIGQVAVATDVGHALAHLVVQDVID